MPLREDTPAKFDTPEDALDSYIWANNSKDYLTYLECIGKSGNYEITCEDTDDMELWGQIENYEDQKVTRYADWGIVRVQQDYKSAGGNFSISKRLYGQLKDYYFIERDGRWVYLEEGLERTVVTVKNFIWSMWSD